MGHMDGSPADRPGARATRLCAWPHERLFVHAGRVRVQIGRWQWVERRRTWEAWGLARIRC